MTDIHVLDHTIATAIDARYVNWHGSQYQVDPACYWYNKLLSGHRYRVNHRTGLTLWVTPAYGGIDTLDADDRS